MEGSSDLEKIKSFLKSTEITWPNGYGAGETIEALEVQGFPTVYVVSRDGHIVWDSIANGGSLDAAIEAALK